MARVTHVRKAQQRYKTVPVLDENGEPRRTPVMRKVKDRETGQVTEVQKTTKKGRPVFMTQTVSDKSQPLDPETCDYCRGPITVGTPYKHVTPKSGPYGGRKRSRHEGCPTWQVWDLSNSMSAQIARIEFEFESTVSGAESPDDVTSALESAAEEVRSIADEKREGAENIESGFGHPTYQSEELTDVADQLESWADDIESTDVPEMSECGECTDGQKDCDTCNGTGKTDIGDGEVDCDECSGTGEIECENCDGTGEDLEEWRNAVADEVTVMQECPV